MNQDERPLPLRLYKILRDVNGLSKGQETHLRLLEEAGRTLGIDPSNPPSVGELSVLRNGFNERDRYKLAGLLTRFSDVVYETSELVEQTVESILSPTITLLVDYDIQGSMRALSERDERESREFLETIAGLLDSFENHTQGRLTFAALLMTTCYVTSGLLIQESPEVLHSIEAVAETILEEWDIEYEGSERLREYWIELREQVRTLRLELAEDESVTLGGTAPYMDHDEVEFVVPAADEEAGDAEAGE